MQSSSFCNPWCRESASARRFSFFNFSTCCFFQGRNSLIYLDLQNPRIFFRMLKAGESAEELTDISERGQEAFHELESSKKPFVAAIHGVALGGGLEVCGLRIAR